MQLAHFRQRKTKGDCTHPKKTPAKRKGTTVNAPVTEESPVAGPGDGGLLGGLDVGKNPTCGDTPDGAGAAQLQEPGRERTPPKLDGYYAEQPGVMTKMSTHAQQLAPLLVRGGPVLARSLLSTPSEHSLADSAVSFV
ncbi:hypothetical protein Celaphus_00012828 [Cervus elaphus hippelaphus]|uniref:Uncharacterized protein n=1 Tax=Cervus elaphus hippelaphus TaxID=46360 RepID=A0A212CJ04_CEREH|nr:hypothetical protein Celaphus_00012828 [Cervus elaphus hippelaphus]